MLPALARSPLRRGLLLALLLPACGPSPAMDAAPPPPPAPPPSADMPEKAVAPAAPMTATAPVLSAVPAVAASAAPPPAPAAASVLKLGQGQLADADKILSGADAKVRECVAKAKTPPTKGDLLVKITVATSGFALNVVTTPSGDVGKDVATCAKTALRDYTFGKPVGGGVAAVAGTFVFP